LKYIVVFWLLKKVKLNVPFWQLYVEEP